MSTIESGDFLESIQTLILNNDLNSSYKLALVIAITEAVLEINPLTLTSTNIFIPYTELSRRFLKLYWTHGKPYVIDRQDIASPVEKVLVQTVNGGNLKIISLIEEFKAKYGDGSHRDLSFERASLSDRFEGLVRECNASVLTKNPLHYIKGFEFLFTNNKARKAIELTPAVVFLLHRFHPMIIELAQNRWENHIRRLKPNTEVLAESRTGTLKDFLFNNAKRESLQIVSKILKALNERDHCFYCGAPLHLSDIDHFLPFSRFRPHRLCNYVAACPTCNRSKSDNLADLDFKAQWEDRNLSKLALFNEIGQDYDIEPGLPLLEIHTERLYRSALEHREKLWRPGN